MPGATLEMSRAALEVINERFDRLEAKLVFGSSR
jgi:hypothetical protein